MEKSTANWHASLKILFSTLLVGQILVCGVAYFVMSPSLNVALADSNFVKLTPVFMLLLDAAGFWLGQNRTASAAQIADISQKFAAYRTAQVIKFGLTEGATMIAATLYFVSGETKLLFYALANLAVFAAYFPAKHKIVSDLQLSAQEKALLDDPDFRG